MIKLNGHDFKEESRRWMAERGMILCPFCLNRLRITQDNTSLVCDWCPAIMPASWGSR